MKTRIPALDGIRGLAILGVLCFHECIFFLPENPFEYWIKRTFHAGWIGVDLFFVLSGFLITNILLRSREKKGYFVQFYRRRVLRIFPLYYLALLFIFGLLPLITDAAGISGYSWIQSRQLWFWSYLQNWLFATGGFFPEFHSVEHFWTLALEEQFYLVWPFLVFVLGVRNLKWLCVAVCVGAFGLRIGYHYSGAEGETIYTHTLTRMDSLAFGCLLALAPAAT